MHIATLLGFPLFLIGLFRDQTICCKGSLDVVVIALGSLKTSLLTSTKGNTLSAYLS